MVKSEGSCTSTHPIFTLYFFMAWNLIKGYIMAWCFVKHRDNFTFTLTSIISQYLPRGTAEKHEMPQSG
jgi:hypothetical protein